MKFPFIFLGIPQILIMHSTVAGIALEREF